MSKYSRHKSSPALSCLLTLPLQSSLWKYQPRPRKNRVWPPLKQGFPSHILDRANLHLFRLFLSIGAVIYEKDGKNICPSPLYRSKEQTLHTLLNPLFLSLYDLPSSILFII